MFQNNLKLGTRTDRKMKHEMDMAEKLTSEHWKTNFDTLTFSSKILEVGIRSIVGHRVNEVIRTKQHKELMKRNKNGWEMQRGNNSVKKGHVWKYMKR